jgi:hypothetical protein
MPQTSMTASEQGTITAIQTALGDAKTAIRVAMNGLTDLMTIQKSAGRSEAYDEAFRMREALRVVLGQAGVAHADGSLAMARLFSDAGPVIFGGGR